MAMGQTIRVPLATTQNSTRRRADKHSRTKLRIATWNVQSLCRTGNVTALSHQLSRMKVDICALQESRLHMTEQMTAGEYVLMYSGHPSSGRNGVAVAVHKRLKDKIQGWKAISDRQMTIRIEIGANQHIQLICCYSPTDQVENCDATKTFYEQIQSATDATCRSDTLIIAGDFNAQVGSENLNWPICLGAFGHGNISPNGQKLLEFASQNQLCLSSSFFRQKVIHKVSWYSNTGKVQNVIDHILCRQSDRQCVLDTRVYRSAEFDSDHMLVMMKFRLRQPKIRQWKALPTQRRFNIAATLVQSTRDKYLNGIKTAYSEATKIPPVDSQLEWNSFKTAVLGAAATHLGYQRKKKTPLVTDGTLKLIDAKRTTRLQLDSLQTSRQTRQSALAAVNAKRLLNVQRRAVRTSLKADKNSWWTWTAEEINNDARANNSRSLFSTIKRLTTKWTPTPPVKSRLGANISDKAGQLERWKDHFCQLLNVSQTSDPLDIQARNAGLNAPPIHHSEVDDSVQRIKNNKSPGIDNLTAELLKVSRDTFTPWLTRLFNQVWESEEIPEDWKIGVIIPLLKKGDATDCNNYRGITLLSVVGKIFTSILLARINAHLNSQWKETQAGFRPNRSTIDNIFTIRQMADASETWNLKKSDAKKIDSFDCRCLRRLLGVRWWQFVTNEKVWQMAESIPPSMSICTSRLRWYGHVNRMEKTWLPLRVYEAQPRNGRRTKGGQKTRWRDVIMADIGRMGHSMEMTVKRLCQRRPAWKTFVNGAAKAYEDDYFSEKNLNATH